MTNRIREIDVRTHRLSPTEAELWVQVTADQITPTTAIQGRFVGPKSPSSSTIEVAYPLRRFPSLPAELPPLSARVVIPEPSIWTDDTPFIYDGVIELWQDGKCQDVRQISGYKLLTANSTTRRSP